MNLILITILIILLAVVVFQDFKSRTISWFLIPLLLIGFVGFAFLQINTTELLTYIGINLYIIFSTLLGASLIISIKNRKITNIVNTYIGLGDVLFFVVLATVFSPFNFILFFIGSIFISSVIFGGITLFSKKQVLTPLAGTMSAMLIIIIVVVQFIPTLHFYQDIIFLFE